MRLGLLLALALSTCEGGAAPQAPASPPSRKCAPFVLPTHPPPVLEADREAAAAPSPAPQLGCRW